MFFFIAVCLLPAFAISFVATALMRKLAPKCGLIDQPAAREERRLSAPASRDREQRIMEWVLAAGDPVRHVHGPKR